MSGEALPDISGEWSAAMRRGDWEAAWRATDRLELPRRVQQRTPGFRRRPEHLRWDGTPPAGRTVLVRCEHGLGDTLQFMRFIPYLGAADVQFMVQPHLLRLLQGAPGLGQVRNYWTDDPPPPHDVDLEVMELAYVLRATLDTLPPPYPHLRRRLPQEVDFAVDADDRLRVALLWSASDWGHDRSAPLPELAPLFEVDGLRFHSLQQGAAAADPLVQRLGIVPLSQHTGEIALAAVALCQMDLVICADSMLAHLAGTLGRPTWVLLKHDADWRWMDARTDSPWYPGMRLFRQAAPGDWREVARQVATALRALVRRTDAGLQGLSAAVPAR